MNFYFRRSCLRKAAWSVIGLVLFAPVAALVFQNSRVSTYPVGWERSFQLSSFNVVARNAAAASQDNFIAVVYEGISGKGREIYASFSFNAGASVLPSLKVADASSKTELNPHVAIARSGAVSVMWQGYVDGESATRIFYSTSKDFGATWTAPRKLILGKQTEMLPRIYYDDRNVLHLFYHGSVDGNINLFHAESPDGVDFTTTGSLIRLSGSVRGAFFPSICLSGEDFHIVWQGKEEDFSDELFFIKSSNYGRSWSSKKRITGSAGNNEVPAVAKYGNVLYVVYQNNDEKNWAIKMIRSNDRGRTWEAVPLKVSTTVANCYSPAVGIFGTDLLIVWYDTRAAGGTIYSRKYSIKDDAFMPEVPVSDTPQGSKNPAILVLSNRSFLFWEGKNVIMAKQTDVSAEPPRVYSDTNPEGRWSRLPYVMMRWYPPADESGIAGYAAIMNDQPDFNPTVVNLKPEVTRQRITDLSDGVSYFHIRAVDNAGNYSRTIHYKLQLAINPMPEPSIASATHEQGKPNRSPAPSFTWSLGGMERVKGFVYGLSRDTIRMPDHFTTDMNVQLKGKGLEDGNYFFSVAAVDKSNQPGRVSTYAFIVGGRENADPDYYKKVAKEERKFERRYAFAPAPVRAGIARPPKVTINPPAERSPYVYYTERIMGKLSSRLGFMSVAFFGLAIAATTLGYGKRIRFYVYLFLFKISVAYRLFLKKN